MARDDMETKLRVGGDTKGAQNALEQLRNKFKSFFGDIGKNMLSFAAGMGVWTSFQSALRGVVNELKDSVQKYLAAEEALVKMNLGLVSAGIYSKDVSDRFRELADSIQRATGYSDEEIESTVSLIASLADLSEEGLREATIAVTDLAAGLGISLPEAGRMLAQSLVGQRNVLKKWGVEININADATTRLSQILPQVAERWGGWAKIIGETDAGKIRTMRQVIDDLKEAIGRVLVLPMRPFIEEFTDFLSAERISTMQTALYGVGAAFKTAYLGSVIFYQAQMATIQAVVDTVEVFRRFLDLIFDPKKVLKKEAWADLWKGLKEVYEDGTGSIIKDIEGTAKKITETWEKVVEGSWKASDIDYSGIGKGAREVGEEFEKAGEKVERMGFAGASLEEQWDPSIDAIYRAGRSVRNLTGDVTLLELAWTNWVRAALKTKDVLNEIDVEFESTSDQLVEARELVNEYVLRIQEGLGEASFAIDDFYNLLDQYSSVTFQNRYTELDEAVAKQQIAIFSAIIDMARAAVEALPKFWKVAAVIAYGLAQIAIIKSQKRPAAQLGAIVGGGYGGGDRNLTLTESGEMVLRKEVVRRNRAMFDMMGAGEGGQVVIPVYIGTKHIYTEVSEAIERRGILVRQSGVVGATR